jgi:hypothetical protein
MGRPQRPPVAYPLPPVVVVPSAPPMPAATAPPGAYHVGSPVVPSSDAGGVRGWRYEQVRDRAPMIPTRFLHVWRSFLI